MRVIVKFTVKNAVCMSLRLTAYGKFDCDFGFDSQEWICSQQEPLALAPTNESEGTCGEGWFLFSYRYCCIVLAAHILLGTSFGTRRVPPFEQGYPVLVCNAHPCALLLNKVYPIPCSWVMFTPTHDPYALPCLDGVHVRVDGTHSRSPAWDAMEAALREAKAADPTLQITIFPNQPRHAPELDCVINDVPLRVIRYGAVR